MYTRDLDLVLFLPQLVREYKHVTLVRVVTAMTAHHVSPVLHDIVLVAGEMSTLYIAIIHCQLHVTVKVKVMTICCVQNTLAKGSASNLRHLYFCCSRRNDAMLSII